ncbi:ribose ABC transporter permease [Aliifodinibius sp. S!AR15-10]|uniref:ABC transporter permease n=1 Tax=Aliifodinibius sp. S!AR15-10 TaxID=2950437 RepID=UPI0028668396|nr:ribose ABC transporter permease [Aliifodinibius sp. S!AR15-10]MDR8392702.1 ribose ABC transporter permease [Aliifodinibius sp. S!AR15-10]
MNEQIHSGIQKLSAAIGQKSAFSLRLQKYGVLIAFILICVGISIMSPNFLTVTNLLIVVRQITINAMLAFGVTFVIISGGIDLSMGSVVAVAGVVAASFAHPGSYPLIVPLFAGLAVGVLIGAFNGFVITKGNVPPFIVTLGTMTIGRGLALIFSGGRPISNLSDSFGYIGGGELFGIPFPIVILGIIFVLCLVLLKKTVLGRYIYAVGGNEEAARASGINVKKIKIIVYTLCGGLSALGGIILASRISTGQPNVGVAFELDAIAAVVIGGTSLSGGIGTMTGTLIGALLIGVIGNGLDLMNVSSYYQQVVMGSIIIGAVLLDSIRRRNLSS